MWIQMPPPFFSHRKKPRHKQDVDNQDVCIKAFKAHLQSSFKYLRNGRQIGLIHPRKLDPHAWVLPGHKISRAFFSMPALKEIISDSRILCSNVKPAGYNSHWTSPSCALKRIRSPPLNFHSPF